MLLRSSVGNARSGEVVVMVVSLVMFEIQVIDARYEEGTTRFYREGCAYVLC